MSSKTYFIVISVFSVISLSIAQSNTNIDWSCVNNLTCVQRVAKNVINNLKNHRSIDLGFMEINPIKKDPHDVASARSSNWWDLFSGNSIKFAVGPMLLGIEKSRKFNGYWEVALLRKGKGARSHQDRKHMQFFVPGFLVAGQIGWYLLAIGAVKILAIKAILVAKLAFIVAAVMTIKKVLFEQEPMYQQGFLHPPYYEHPEPLMMPYSMDFAHLHHPYHSSDMNDMYPISVSSLGHDQTSALHHAGSIGAESALNNVVDSKNVAPQQPAVQSAPAVPVAPVAAITGNIKRYDEFYPVDKPSNYYYKQPSRNPAYPLLLRKT